MVRMKKRGALALALLCLVLAFVPNVVYGANAVDTEAECTLSFALSEEYAELLTMQIPVTLYKVADVTVNGAYEAVPGYEALDGRLGSVDAQTTAENWGELAAKAAEIALTDDQGIETMLENGSGQLTLPTGLYLVSSEAMETREYGYTFIPYLVSLPGNDYGSTGDDTWKYEVTIGLKPQQDNRLGRLVIEKMLRAYNATLGGASFVFQVEGRLDGETVYSNVVSLTFDGPGLKSIEIEGLPAGAQITVREIYSGACYRSLSDTLQNTQIIADGVEGAPVHVYFESTYDEYLRGGSSVINHFIYNENGTYDWEQE